MKHRVTDIHDYFEKYRPFARTFFRLGRPFELPYVVQRALIFSRSRNVSRKLAASLRMPRHRVHRFAAQKPSEIRRKFSARTWNQKRRFDVVSTWIKMAFRFHSKVLINVKRNRVKKSLFFFFSTRSIANHGIFLSNIEQVSAAVVRTWWWAINSKPINKDVSSRNRNATRTYIPIRIIDYDEGGSLTLQNTKKWITRIRN